MTKKLLALLMAMMLVFCGCAALAEAAPEETEKLEYDYASVETFLSDPNHKGNFVEYKEQGFKFWVPSPMEQGGMTQEMVDGDCIDFFVAASMPQYNIVVRHTDYAGLVDSFDQLVSVAPQVYQEYRLGTVNGHEALIARQNDGDAMVVVIPDVQGKFLEISYNGCSDQNFIPDVGISIACIQFED